MKCRLAITAALFLAVFLFWWLAYPHALSYQEQNQLFLWTGDYLGERLSVPGGLAHYLGECITQFYLIPWLGALLLALLFTALQQLMQRVLIASIRPLTAQSKSPAPCTLPPASIYIMSFLPCALLLGHLGDENVLCAYPVALVLTLMAACMAGHTSVWADLAVLPLLYWCVGPVAWLYVGLRIVRMGLRSAWLALFMALVLFVANWLLPNPAKMVWWGFSYYRIPLMTPMLQIVIPIVIFLLALVTRCVRRKTEVSQAVKTLSMAVCAAVLAVLAWLAVDKGFDADKYELIRQDYLIRNERWDDIIERAEHKVVKTPFWSQSVNLALAMTHQLAERQFMFYQSGTDALLMPAVHDNTSGWPSAEAFWRLGMVNTAQRYFFETQNAILDHRLSGRCMKRLAECAIVNGQYEVARRYLGMLTHTTFYRSWAQKAMQCLNDEAVTAHQVWGPKRNLRFQSDFLFSWPVIDQMLGLLFYSHHNNRMALEYMMAQMLLNGNIQGFMQSMGAVERYGGYARMPMGYQEVVQSVQGQTGADSGFMEYINRMNHHNQQQ